jgi:hypothetical protein
MLNSFFRSPDEAKRNPGELASGTTVPGLRCAPPGLRLLLLEIGIPVAAMRAYFGVSRAGGLVGHLLEEKTSHSGRAIWAAAKAAVPHVED